MKYLQARLQASIFNHLILFLYISGVGAALFFDYEGIRENFDDWRIWLGFLGGYVLLQFPFDYLGGFHLQKKYGRYLEGVGPWFLSWLRGTASLIAFYALHGGALILLGGWGGIWAVAGWIFIWSLLLTGFRQYLARLMAPFKVRYESNRGRLVFFFESLDRGFTGGISGMPGQESIVMPAYWNEKWDSSVFDLQLSRRHGSLNTGSHGGGLFGSILLHTAIFTLSAFLAGELGSFSSLVLALCMYSMLAVLLSVGLIPSLNRRGTFQMDRWVYYKKVDGDIIREAIEKSRHLQDDPGYRLPSIAKASPSLEERQKARSTGKDIKGAWHMASVWYYYGLFLGNVFARSSPANLGLPSRWGFTPME